MEISCPNSSLKVLSGLKEIIDKYDLFLVDQYGVLHDGTNLYPDVHATLEEIYAQGKLMIILSNTSRRKSSLVHGIMKMNMRAEVFAGFESSGELALRDIGSRAECLTSKDGVLANLQKLDKWRVFVIGNGEEDEEYLRLCGCIPSIPESADFILARGTNAIYCDEKQNLDSLNRRFSSKELLNVIGPWLTKCAEKDLPMIITNPDFQTPGSYDPRPGCLGLKYAEINPNAKIFQYGKPYEGIYKSAIEFAKNLGHNVDVSRICCVGDSLEHDIKGANNMGLDSVWVVNGVLSQELNVEEGSKVFAGDEAIEAVIRKYKAYPTYAIPLFSYDLKIT